MNQRTPAEASKPSGTALEVVAFVGDSEAEDTLEDAVAQHHIHPVHIARGNVRDAIKFLEKQERSPRLLIVDVSGMELPLSEIDALAEACEPSINVIVLGDRQDVGLFRELIRLGVADYLVKPVLPDLIAPHLSGTTANLRAQPNRTGKVVAVTGVRGGVGATSVASGVSWILANKHNRRVVLVDLNPYGGALGVQLDLSGGGLVEALDNAAHLDALFLERTLSAHGPRLFLLSGEEPMDQDIRIAEKDLEALIQALERQFHYVVIDVPHWPSSAYAYVLRRAGVRVLMADRTVPAVRDLARILNIMDGTSGRSLLVLNDSRPNIESLADQKSIEESLARSFDFVLPFDKTVPKVMDNLGEPIAEAGGAFAESLRDLANALSGQRRRKAKGWLRLVRSK